MSALRRRRRFVREPDDMVFLKSFKQKIITGEARIV